MGSDQSQKMVWAAADKLNERFLKLLSSWYMFYAFMFNVLPHIVFVYVKICSIMRNDLIHFRSQPTE